MPKKKTRNKFEQKIERSLKKSKISFKYESERIPYLIAGHYIPDFVLTTKRGKIFLETKGHFRPEAKRKMVAVKKLNPSLDIRLIFYSRKLKDIRWAEKHGFLYSIETVPKDWLDELR